MKKIDCRNLECPQPVVETKNAVAALKDGESLEILLNTRASFENVPRFLASQGQKFEARELGNGEFIVVTTKNGEVDLNKFDPSLYTCPPKTPAKKVVYLNDERAGSGEVGMGLLSKFIGALMQLETKPYAVICVNNAVRMTTDRGHASFAALKELEKAGVKILSCGSCLEAYKLVDKLAIGEMTNAYEVVDLLSKYDAIKL